MKMRNILLMASLAFSTNTLALTHEQIRIMKTKPVKQLCEMATKQLALPNWTHLSTKSGKWQGVNLVCAYEGSPANADVTYDMMAEHVAVAMRTEYVPSKREKECNKHFKAVERSTGGAYSHDVYTDSYQNGTYIHCIGHGELTQGVTVQDITIDVGYDYERKEYNTTYKAGNH